MEVLGKSVHFHIKAAPGSDVYVTGSFNGWNRVPTKMEDINGTGDYYVTHVLPYGKHEYKFLINGEYRVDPECPEWTVNDFGTLNSVIEVK